MTNDIGHALHAEPRLLRLSVGCLDTHPRRIIRAHHVTSVSRNVVNWPWVGSRCQQAAVIYR